MTAVRGIAVVAVAAVLGIAVPLQAQQTFGFRAQDPGVRGGQADAGGPINGLSAGDQAFFGTAKGTFQEVDAVSPGSEPGTNGSGLGPRFNMNSCSGCHAQPAAGGTSPFTNPQVAVATRFGAQNTVPFFITSNGPVREVRFKRNPDGSPDGGVHDLFTITGRRDAAGCSLTQPDFNTAIRNNNAIFRIPTPTFGAGLIETIRDSTILANKDSSLARQFGVSGHENRTGNDGTITRFGWKAQNKSLELFAGEAYNVEQGVTNEIFQNERDETQGCQFNGTPEDRTNVDGSGNATPADVVQFAFFGRTLAPPTPRIPNGISSTDVAQGGQVFMNIGCAACHTPVLKTGTSSFGGLSNQNAALFSDLLVHNMGTNLSDGVSQGNAGPDEFRTAPLWGLGQRIFLLHDGRSTDLGDAIRQHASQGSEANGVINNFNGLSEGQKQQLYDFLRTL